MDQRRVWSRRRMLEAAAAGVSVGSVEAAGPVKAGLPAVIAHRGGAALAPENTLAAIRTAIALGADYVELDVRTTRDGKLVLMHDARVDRTTSGQGLVRELLAAEIRKLDAGARFGDRFRGERVPTLESALDLCRNRVRIYLDHKDAQVESVMELLRRERMLDQVAVYAGLETLREWKRCAPEISVLPSLPAAQRRAGGPATFRGGLLPDFRPEILEGNAALWTPALVRETQEAGCRVFLDALGPHDTREGLQKLLDWGIDGIQTDHPDWLVELRNRSPQESVSQWNGFERLDFRFNGRGAILVRPATPAPGRPWIWRTEFFGHEPQGDLALLRRGFHVASLDLQNLYGGPVALEWMDAFHREILRRYRLSARVALEGFSRGGLFALNWAAARPKSVSFLYLDAPVCDFKSWPAGWGKGKGSPTDWERCKLAYGLTDATARSYSHNPVDQLADLAKDRVPILSICGDADDVVPLAENSGLLAERYRALRGPISMIIKPGIGHHPHSLPDPTPILEFAEQHRSRW